MERKKTSWKTSPDLIKATQAILSVGQKYGVSLGTWSQGTDKETSEVLIFLPKETLQFYQAEEFLRCLKNTWAESGFSIIDETMANNYNCIGGIAPSICFRLRAA